ncbi:MAG: class I SAM-dependent methyltransferase [Actinobacteria bacterium]|nr:class I SAM-dependent methyltransferase [Actinomycetota bacterium]MCA1737933.1 class I SAM-dependent methyltransferase [Actinomycetota bacterium]
MSQRTAGRERADYGLDAPGAVRNLAVFGGLGVVLGIVLYFVLAEALPVLAVVFLNWGVWGGLSALIIACAMVLSSRVGKLRFRERLVDAIPWRGDERVLDVGCGRGLMLVGAARRLTAGKAVGVDIWQSEDQSGNRPEATRANAKAEGVADRVEVRDGDARELPFEDGAFDVVLSNMALHNIPDATGRESAVREISRVLNPGGRLMLVDIWHTGQYARVLRESGVSDVARSGLRFLIFPPVRVISGRKKPTAS